MCPFSLSHSLSLSLSLILFLSFSLSFVGYRQRGQAFKSLLRALFHISLEGQFKRGFIAQSKQMGGANFLAQTWNYRKRIQPFFAYSVIELRLYKQIGI